MPSILESLARTKGIQYRYVLCTSGFRIRPVVNGTESVIELEGYLWALCMEGCRSSLHVMITFIHGVLLRTRSIHQSDGGRYRVNGAVPSGVCREAEHPPVAVA